ncbi:uncharacterized protein LOC131931160 [Physella acuta]|uniref:uncharacterized protein LOC131931160 n=1 Tax=Physella acuta TaxID=109671 RepID=UPI0027DAB80B|nr:uncharacterized protein LOC131931160 [Physella acuta]
MRFYSFFALVLAVSSGQRLETSGLQRSQCTGLARRSRQVPVDVPLLYNMRTRELAEIPQQLYNAHPNFIARLEIDGWVVQTRRTIATQVVNERVPVCCPWDQNCQQMQQRKTGIQFPCANGGQMVILYNVQKCVCRPGFRGVWCQIPDLIGLPENVAPFPHGPVIRGVSPYTFSDGLANQELSRQQQERNSFNRDQVLRSQQALLWHQQVLRSRLAQAEEYYRRLQGQLTPAMLQSMQEELQRKGAGNTNPYSTIQPEQNLFHRLKSDQMQSNQYSYMPRQGVPEARTPWDLDPFNMQQFPGFRNDARSSIRERQMLAMAFYQQMMDQYKPITRNDGPLQSKNNQNQLQGVKEDLQSVSVKDSSSAQAQAVGTRPDELLQVEKCQSVLQPKLDECLGLYDITLQQFMNPEYINKARVICQNDASVGQCITRLDTSCGEVTARKMINSILKMMGLVCQHIRTNGGKAPMPETSNDEKPIQEEPVRSSNTEIGASPPLAPVSEEMLTTEERQLLEQCQPILEPKINECMTSNELTIQEFINPTNMDKARGLCREGHVVGQCITNLDKACGQAAVLTARKMISSVLRMMGVVCQHIQMNGPLNGGSHSQARADKKNSEPVKEEPVKEEPVQMTSQNKQEKNGPSANLPSEQRTPATHQEMQQCLLLLETKVNECLTFSGLTITDVFAPANLDKARHMCRDNTQLDECIMRHETACAQLPVSVTRPRLMAVINTLNMYCKQIQSSGQADPDSQKNEMNQPEMPGSASVQEQIQKCQLSLEPKINECLHSYGIVLQQFMNPEFIDKSRSICLDSKVVVTCIVELEKVCGVQTVETTRRMLQSLLRTMSMVCERITSTEKEMTSGQGGTVTDTHTLRSGVLGHPSQEIQATKGQQLPHETASNQGDNEIAEVKNELPVKASLQESPSDVDKMKYISRHMEAFGYPLWLIITLILILVVLSLLSVMVICLCVRRRRKQNKVIITREIEKVPIPIDEKMCTIGIPPPSYTTTTIRQTEDGLALPPLDLADDSANVKLDQHIKGDDKECN